MTLKLTNGIKWPEETFHYLKRTKNSKHKFSKYLAVCWHAHVWLLNTDWTYPLIKSSFGFLIFLWCPDLKFCSCDNTKVFWVWKMDRPTSSGDFETFLYDKLLFLGLYLWFVLSSKCDNNPSIISPYSTKNHIMIRALRTPVRSVHPSG